MPRTATPVTLPEEKRQQLRTLTRAGTASVREITRARILLKLDEGYSGAEIADHLDVGTTTVERVKKRFLSEGVEGAVEHRKQQAYKPRKIDGRLEAHLIALAAGDPPEGRSQWSLRLLADRLVELAEFDSISPETVRRTLNDNELKPHLKRNWCIPPKQNAAFVCAMEDVLDLYEEEYDPLRPVVCFDEKPCQLIGDVQVPIPASPGKPKKVDYEYQRNGVANIFGYYEPLTGWCEMEVTERRTAADFARCLKRIVDKFYPHAEKVRVVLDNLSTHTLAPLYLVYEPEEARRIAQKVELHYTPKHGSWLNAVEIEFSVLGRQCLNERVDSIERLKTVVRAWTEERNALPKKLNWQFRTNDARNKLVRLYPSAPAEGCTKAV